MLQLTSVSPTFSYISLHRRGVVEEYHSTGISACALNFTCTIIIIIIINVLAAGGTLSLDTFTILCLVLSA